MPPWPEKILVLYSEIGTIVKLNCFCFRGTKSVPIYTVAALLAVPAKSAWAGMPSFNWTDLATTRIEVISFFLVGFLVSAFVVRWIWNTLRNDFSFLPLLSYTRACGLVALWGLLFVVVLTMISGARELMTPGAWKKKGLTYELAETAAPAIDIRDENREKDSMETRRRHLELLGRAIDKYTLQHDGQIPPHYDTKIPFALWRMPAPSLAPYIYFDNLNSDQPELPVAYEPEVFEGDLWVLFTNGTMRRMSRPELRVLLSKGER